MNHLEKKSFLFEDNYLVWKIIKAKDDNLLVVELRNPAELYTAFVCIDLNKQEILWDDLAFEDTWSISISGMNSEYLFFTEFTDGQIPEAKAVFSISLETKEMGWYLENTIFEAVTDEYVLLKENIDGEFQNICIDKNTGESIENSIDLSSIDLFDSHIEFPLQYEEGSDYFNTVNEFMHNKKGISITKACDYLEWNSYIIIAYYQNTENKALNNYIIILNKMGKVLFEDQLGKGLKGIASESFFIAEEKLIYIKDKREISTINLTSTL